MCVGDRIPTPNPTPTPPSTSIPRPLFSTADIWQAAYTLAYGIRLVRTTIGADDRVYWELDNTDDAAWKAGQEFRHGGDLAVVPILRFRTCHRYLARQATIARKEGSVDAAPDPRC